MNDEEIKYEVAITSELVDAFVQLTGDKSSIHTNSEFARMTRFRQRVVHGMLPLVFIGAWLRESNSSQELKRLKGSFLHPIYFDDIIEIHIKKLKSLEFNCYQIIINRKGENLILTNFDIETISSDQKNEKLNHLFNNFSGFTQLKENIFSLEELQIGAFADLKIPTSQSSSQKCLELFKSKIQKASISGTPLIESNLFSTLFISTLVGMQIPGKNATFLEFSLDFYSSDKNSPDLLIGQIETILKGSSKIKVGISFRAGDQLVASGHFWSLVGTPPPPSITIEQIQLNHLSLGLKDRVVLVTGASRGIGESTVKLLSLLKAKVVVHYFRGKDSAEGIVKEIKALGGDAMAVGCDIRDENAVEAMFKKIELQWGGVDILVNNAVDEFTPTEYSSLKWEDFMKEIEVSLHGTHNCCLQALPYMRKNKWGKIINIGTVAVDNPVSGQNKYITVKSALLGFTRSLAVEEAKNNIQINMVVPSMTRTTLISSLSSEIVGRLAREVPSGNILEPIEVSRTIAFLSSEWSRPISGQRIILNQGSYPFL